MNISQYSHLSHNGLTDILITKRKEKGVFKMQYQNPILNGDYSDPDVIRVGQDYYMISSSFTYVPGIPLLHSRDLVHWEIINYVVQQHIPFSRYDQPVHKCGTWAPSIRYHQGRFYVYVCLPDEGLFAYTAADPRGEWTCHYVKDVCGWIDPCPFFDEDGQTYLVHGFAGSRAGIKNILYLHRMSADGLAVLDEGRMVFDGCAHGDVTTEGPKMYKRDGKYYILCPAGGVKQGYQLALRADKPFGVYERKVVLAQGESGINGPHQGGLVDTPSGESWFIHFQDVAEYGRIPHLQPVNWVDGWPIMGNNGEPVLAYEAPNTGVWEPEMHIPMSDDFKDGMGLQWQWQSNPRTQWRDMTPAGLKLHAAPAPTLFEAGQFLSQLMQFRDFDMDVSFELQLKQGDWAGVGVMGYDYHYIAARQGQLAVVGAHAQEINRRGPERVHEQVVATAAFEGTDITFRLRVREGMACYFYKADGAFVQLGEAYPLVCGGWTGARPGIFCINKQGAWGGYALAKNCEVRCLDK